MTEPWGLVPVQGRGSLPFLLVHGESLVATASLALEAAGVVILDVRTDWAQVRRSGRSLVLHDPLCPMTPPAFLGEAVALGRARSATVVGSRPVTDTLKRMRPGPGLGVVGPTVDRDSLVQVLSPVVLPPGVVAELDAPPAGGFAAVVDRLRARFPVLFLTAPAAAHRVVAAQDVALLEALGTMG